MTCAATPEDQARRTRGFVVTQASLMVGIVVGPLSGGFLTSAFGFAATGGVAACLSLFSLLWVLPLRETLPAASKAKAFDWKENNTCVVLFRFFSCGRCRCIRSADADTDT